MAKHKARVRRVEKSNGMIHFLLQGKYWDSNARDYLASIGNIDPMDEIKVFTKAGYTDDMIIAVYDALRDAGDLVAVTLPKPVTVSFDLE